MNEIQGWEVRRDEEVKELGEVEVKCQVGSRGEWAPDGANT